MTACDPKATLNILVKLALPLLISLAIDGQTVLASDKVEVIDASRVQRFAMDPFKDSEGQNPIFYTEWTGILGRFGEPPNTEETKVAERTSDEILTTHWLQYDGLTIGIVESEDKEHSWLETVVISGNARPLKFGIEIGTAFSDLVTLLQIPPPRYRAKSAALYLHPEIRGHWADYRDQFGQPKFVYANISLYFYFDAEDRVERIVFAASSD